MAESYWTRVLERRLSRRRALAATGETAAAAALLAACGGGESGGGETGGDKSGLITQPVDTSKEAKIGGTSKFFITSDPAHLDLHIAIAPLESPQGHVYSRLTQIKAGVLKPTDNEIVPDLAESWEWSPDRLQLTMKLRQGVTWHNKAPVNGRVFDMDDVLFSWDRYSRQATNRTQLSNAASPEAPVLSVTATDPRTVVFKLKYPVVYVLAIMGNYLSGNFTMIPKETDSTFDIRRDMIGTGPFVMSNYSQSIGFTFKRNPNYYEKGRPWIETVEMPIISEYAQGLAQLKAGNVYTWGVRPEDIVAVKNETPALNMYADDLSVVGQYSDFGWLPAGKSAFLDERVRQAVSMSYDRDLFIETFYNVTPFRSQGLPVNTAWNSSLAATFPGWWLDPQDTKNFGPNAKYFQHDLTEAKKLLAAAGYPTGFNIVSHIPFNGYTDTYRKQVEVLEGMAAEAGFKVVDKTLDDYVTVFQPKYRDSKGNFEGWSFRATAANTQDPLTQLMAVFYSKLGVQFAGFDATGKSDFSGDPYLETQFEAARGEIDVEKRRAILHEVQRYLGKTQYAIKWPGGANGFLLAWPALANFQVLRGDQRQPNYVRWIDETKAPISKT